MFVLRERVKQNIRTEQNGDECNIIVTAFCNKQCRKGNKQKKKGFHSTQICTEFKIKAPEHYLRNAK